MIASLLAMLTYSAHYSIVMNFLLLHSRRDRCSALFSDGTSDEILKWGVATPLKLTLGDYLVGGSHGAVRRGSIVNANIYHRYFQHFIKQSSVAQLASASDCYTSGYQEVGSSSLPGGGLSFCSSSIHQSYSCYCGGTFARMSCRIMFLLHVPLAVSVVAFMCSFLGEEILQTQRTYIDCYTLFLQTDSCVCHPFTRMM